MKKIQDDPDLYCYDLNNAISSTDCTGLIPAPPQSDEEEEAYDAIIHNAVPNTDTQGQTEPS